MSDAWAHALPLFPLPGLVLMPGEVRALHVFEPRYRALVAWCLTHDPHMGIGTLKPGYEADYDASPPIFPEVGVGRIVRHQAMPGGRSNILLEFVSRATLTEEVVTDDGFRRVRVEMLPAPEGAVPDVRLLALQVRAFVGPLGVGEAFFDLRGQAFLDAMARLFVADPDLRRAYLGTSSAGRGAQIVQEALVELLAQAGSVDEA